MCAIGPGPLHCVLFFFATKMRSSFPPSYSKNRLLLLLTMCAPPSFWRSADFTDDPKVSMACWLPSRRCAPRFISKVFFCENLFNLGPCSQRFSCMLCIPINNIPNRQPFDHLMHHSDIETHLAYMSIKTLLGNNMRGWHPLSR